VLGAAAIVFAARLPDEIDALMERAVGATLVGLALVIVVTLVRHGRDFHMRSRWMLVIAWLRHVLHRSPPAEVHVIEHEHAHEREGHHCHEEAEAFAPGMGGMLTKRETAEHRHMHAHVGTLPDDPFVRYGRRTSFGIGMLHGVGAETPTQVFVFATAAGATSVAPGLVVLMAFLFGLLAANTLVALTSTFGYIRATRNFPFYAAISVTTAVFSLAVGGLFLAGRGGALPPLLGG
jgi:hypothetical protein